MTGMNFDGRDVAFSLLKGSSGRRKGAGSALRKPRPHRLEKRRRHVRSAEEETQLHRIVSALSLHTRTRALASSTWRQLQGA